MKIVTILGARPQFIKASTVSNLFQTQSDINEVIIHTGQHFEKNMSEDYIDALNQVYNEYFFRYQDTPLVIINTNNIDFVHNQGDLDEVINYIRQPVSGTKFFNPTTGL